jgi:hypothetical protein
MIRLPTIQVSVSQIERAEECPSKWGFERLFDLKEPGHSYGMTFGTVLHSVLERYLSADDHGRDPLTLQPVDLYPPGWQWDLDSGRRIQRDHDGLIKRLVNQAVQKGVLVREPGREVEREFWHMIQAPDPKTQEGGILVRGFKDLEAPGKVGDHKSTKTFKYAKSPAKLQSDLQMGVYGWEHVHTGRGQFPIQVEHYQYDWIDEKVKTTAASLTQAQAQAAFDRMLKTAREMQALYLVKSPFQLPAARDGAGAGPAACSAYGGCGYVSICSKGTIEEFERVRRRLALLKLPKEVQDEATEESNMSLKKALGAKKKLVMDEEPAAAAEEEAPAPATKKAPAKKTPWAEAETEEEPAAETEAEAQVEAPAKKAKADDGIGDALKMVNRAALLKLSREELVDRLVAVFAALKGL